MSFKKMFLSALVVAAFSTFALAQGGQPNQMRKDGDGMKRGGERKMGMMRGGMRMHRGGGMGDFSRLNLTDAQKVRVQSLMESSRKSMESMQAQREEMGKLMMLKRQGLLTTEQGTRLTSLEAQMKTTHERMQNDLLAILTPEQKTLFDQMKNERGGQMRGMREGGERRGGGQMRRGGPNQQGAPMSGGNAPKSQIN